LAKKRINCWEYMKCGREAGGDKVTDLGVCIAASDTSYDGLNSGTCGGRICWAVAGTFCEGKIQGPFSEKRQTCLSCDFYKQVQEEEGIENVRPKFLKYISRDGKNQILNKMAYRYIKAGERFVFQGEIEDTAYIIQRGSCLVIVEKDGELHPVDHYGKGDIVGGLGILTGEPRRAHVEAETDMELWVLKREDFEDISARDPDFVHFLTELIADRLDSRRPTAYRTIGKYVAEHIIGRGAFSIVYKGMNKGLNLPVAIKMMRHDMAMDEDFLNSFRNEGKTIAGLNHENIIKVYDIEERYKTLFIIMEYVEGDSLQKMIKRIKNIPPMLAANFLAQLCSALDYAHKRGIIHRDINPTNIIVQRNDRLKILDFGLACSIGTEDFSNIGTAYYMAPEQIQGDPVAPATDIYALGICAYEMLTGKKPFPEKDLKAVLHMGIKRVIPDPADLVQDLPDELRSFILKATQEDPELRYQNAAQALKAIRPLLKDVKNTRSNLSFEKHKMATFFLIYEDEHQLALNRLINEFSTKVQKLGIELKVADFRDA
jgi:eukaryotic-like serine/threonine-protein kinase